MIILIRITSSILSIAIACHAGLVLTQTMKEANGKRESITNAISIDKMKIRIDGGRDSTTYMVYRGDKKAFYLIDLKQKSYTIMNENQFANSFAKQNQALKKIHVRMKNMPPEKRKSEEEMFSKLEGNNSESNEVVYKTLGDGGKVGSWASEKFEETRGGVKVADVWTASPKALGLQESDVQVFKDMSKFFSSFAGSYSGIPEARQDGLNGFPIRTISYHSGVTTWMTELKNVRKENLSPTLFEIPSGLTERPLPKTK